MKKVSVVLSFILLILLSGCAVIPVVKEVDKEVRHTIETESSKALSELHIQEIIRLTTDGKEVSLSEPFTGVVYVMADRDNIEKLQETTFYLNDVEMTTVLENDEGDFNIRQDGKTYFSVKKVDLENADTIGLKSDRSKEVLVVLRTE